MTEATKNYQSIDTQDFIQHEATLKNSLIFIRLIKEATLKVNEDL